MIRCAALILSLLLGGLVVAEEAAHDALPVFREPPPSYKTIDTVSASSREYLGKTRNGKESYVIREMQRQAQALGGNALLITRMSEIDQVEPVYGARRGSMDYRKVPQFMGAGEAIVIPAD
ncbi:MAG: hypothetical protein ABJ308_09955 [Halieaceae bacterium]